MKKELGILMIMLLTGFGALHATGDDPSMGDFRRIMSSIMAMKVYSYDSETSAVFPNGEKDKLTRSFYMDLNKKRILVKSNKELLFLGDGWAYKADHDKKIITVYNSRKYNEKYSEYLPELETVFDQSTMTDLFNSLVMKEARLLSSKKKGELSTFELGFPVDNSLKGLTLVYNNESKLPERLIIKVNYVNDNQSRSTTYVVTCTNYKNVIPLDLFNMNKYFVIRSGKIVLQQYKNYKISSLL